MCSALAAATLFIAGTSALAANAATPVGEPQLERPTLRSLGAYWIVKGDANQNATVRLDYRKSGNDEWRAGQPLFRVEKGAHATKEHGSKLNVPDDAYLFAGSALMLDANTQYELKLTLHDPDGGEATKTLAARTIAEPAAPSNARVRYVTPGDDGGTGTKADPFKGMPEADKNAQPGDVFILLPGTYQNTRLLKSGAPGKPIIWRGGDDVVIDGRGGARALIAIDVHDVWFENLEIRNAKYALVTHGSERIVLRRSHIHDVEHGLVATQNDKDTVNDYFIADNVFEGRSTWPRSEGIEDRRAVQVTGAGHVVAYNKFTAFGDAVDTMPSPRCEAIDFHNNDIDLMTDDGIEADYGQRNIRVFENRLINVFQGISVQPVYGGPVYVFRNVMYNVCVEPFKMHNGPSGAIFFHNTSVKNKGPLLLWTSKGISNCVYRNNLFVGTTDRYAFENQAPAENCDYDYDGFVGGPFATFLKWNNERYTTIADVRAKAPIYKHAVHIESSNGLFASGAKPPADEEKRVAAPPDLRLANGTAAVDAGQPLPGVNDNFSGKAPDLGAYEVGAPLPHYGPRPARAAAATAK
jgi:hypothetical protein